MKSPITIRDGNMKKILSKFAVSMGLLAVGFIPFAAGYMTGVAEPKTAAAIKEAFTPIVVEVEKIVEVEKKVFVDREVVSQSDIANVMSYLLAAENLHLHVYRGYNTDRMSLDYKPMGGDLRTDISIDLSKYKFPHQALIKLVQDTQRAQLKHKQRPGMKVQWTQITSGD